MSELVIDRPPLSLPGRLRRAVGAAVTDGFFSGASRAARLLPIAHPRLHRVAVERDVPYRGTGRTEHLLDVWRPVDAPGPLPVVLYLHGGGFRILSKDTHWIFGLVYARRGYLVLCVNYHLAPAHPFPTAVEDVSAAFTWLVENAARLGADLSRVVVAGESAGANLAASLALSCCWERAEPYARDVYATGVVPSAIVAACGLYEVSNLDRFAHHGVFWRDRIDEVADAYLDRVRLPDRRTLELADPVVALERAGPPTRPLPPFFLPVGTWDILRPDTHRLLGALTRLGSKRSEAREYHRGPHAFHAFVLLPSARQCWRDTFDFLNRNLGQ